MSHVARSDRGSRCRCGGDRCGAVRMARKPGRTRTDGAPTLVIGTRARRWGRRRMRRQSAVADSIRYVIYRLGRAAGEGRGAVSRHVVGGVECHRGGVALQGHQLGYHGGRPRPRLISLPTIAIAVGGAAPPARLSPDVHRRHSAPQQAPPPGHRAARRGCQQPKEVAGLIRRNDGRYHQLVITDRSWGHNIRFLSLSACSPSGS
jgi:hypothetical protein